MSKLTDYKLSRKTNVSTKTVLTPIETITDPSSGEFDFTNIPQTGKRLIIKGTLRGNISAIHDVAYLYFNNDTTAANYQYGTAGTSGPTWNGATAVYPKIANIPGATNTSADNYAPVEIIIEDYAGSGNKQAVNVTPMYYSTDTILGHIFYTWWDTADAITRVQVQTDNHDTDTLLGELTLYVEEDATIGGVSYLGDAGTTIQALVPVETIDLSVTGVFANIPQNGDRIVVKGSARTAAASNSLMHMWINDDTTATNYHSQHCYGYNGANSSTEANTAAMFDIPGADSDSDQFCQFEVVLENYTGSELKHARSHYGAALVATSQLISGVYEMTHDTDTAAVTQLEFADDGASSISGYATLYIERPLVIAPGKHELETIELTTAGEFDFQNIPGGFRRLIIEGYMHSNLAATFDTVNVWFNNDTTDGNYFYTEVYGFNTGASAGEGAAGDAVTISGTSGIGDSDVFFKFEGYDTDRIKSCRYESSNYRQTGSEIAAFFGYHCHDSMTDPINRITIINDNDPTDELLGRLTLYGEK